MATEQSQATSGLALVTSSLLLHWSEVLKLCAAQLSTSFFQALMDADRSQVSNRVAE